MDAGVFGVECETDGRIAPVARKIGKKCPNSYKKRQKYAQKHFRNIKPDRLLDALPEPETFGVAAYREENYPRQLQRVRSKRERFARFLDSRR